MMFASFCIRAITSFDSTIEFALFFGATPAALEANPKDSLICDFLEAPIVEL
jgi:hypothetical protein